ncbi:methylated-DNA--[protein]-cysteine S-methyltransferase [Pseudonocardia sp. KRD291]|uniref:methylated-DNA--[protein]-cysteine S-methyltransferase n=1 Tax=Pseudonocardia sp. KRD291 TaxID=2792007 RepID=UPI001C4A13E2|nr:methylated-DNA--[protein]-cysteine S-methyltransferase [Pseudonocardia sp. KRD291]MBW0105119.1 methylated-DNA--[protein]-cysteine S-methyltransferase [Pseudonocardia sp. KRD291]
MSTAQILHETGFGTLALTASSAGLTAIRFDTGPGTGPSTARSTAGADPWAAAVLDLARRELDDYAAGHLRRFTVPVDLGRVRGEHRTILDTLAGEVGYGATTTYGALAARLGLIADGPRRVGAAMARNPVLVVVPCHRVVGADGRLVGYAGGVAAKRALLDLESRDRAGQMALGV